MTNEDGNNDLPSDQLASELPTNKVANLIEKYGLGPAYGDKLVELWTADDESRESLRSLANRFNERLLEVQMADNGMSTLDGEISNTYRLLTSDEVSSGNRTEARRRLEQAGIDVEQLERDFVSYQAIRSYLKEYRGAEYEADTDDAHVETTIETIQRLKTRTTLVTENSLQHLLNGNQITLGKFRLFVEINVLCEDCHSQYDIIELFQEGGCNCSTDDSS